MFIIKAFKHFKTICVHKWWVFYYCYKAGITWQGIIHDLSKFSPTEFFESVKYYNGKTSPINTAKTTNGYSKAWQHHKGRNKHHYEYWTDNYDSGTTYIEMPRKYKIEMLCDFLAAARTYSGKENLYKNEYEWWQEKCKKVAMHENTKLFINLSLRKLSEGRLEFDDKFIEMIELKIRKISEMMIEMDEIGYINEEPIRFEYKWVGTDTDIKPEE